MATNCRYKCQKEKYVASINRSKNFEPIFSCTFVWNLIQSARMIAENRKPCKLRHIKSRSHLQRVVADLKVNQGVLAIRGFWGKWKSANYKTANFKDPGIWVQMFVEIISISFSNANWQLSIYFDRKNNHFLSFSIIFHL